MRRVLLACCLVAVVAAAVYAGTLRHGFVWDDTFLILNNRYLRDWSELGPNLTGDFFRKSRDEASIGYWRPVVTLSYMVDRHLFRDQPWGFHLVNLLLHAGSSCLVLLLARALPLPRGVPLGAALLFAVHPAHVESVAWISGRTDLWCGLFALAALRLDLDAARRGSPALRAASLAAFALALLSKEMAAVLPAAVLLRSWLLGPRTRSLPSAMAAVLPWAAVIVAYAALRFGVLGLGTQEPLAAQAGRLALFRTWWAGWIEYLRVLVWPRMLTVEHVVPLARTLLEPRVVAGMAAGAGLLAWAWQARRRDPGLAWALGLFLVSLIPLTNVLLPINAPASVPFPWSERFLYLPSAGFCIVAAWALLEGATRVAGTGETVRRVAAGLMAVAVAACGARTVARARDWRDDLHLFQAAVRDAPGSSLAHLNLGVALADAGRLDEAEAEYRIALPLTYNRYKVHYNLGNLHRVRGEAAAAEREYRRAVAQKPTYAPAHLNLGLVLLATGRRAEALAEFTTADTLLPGFVEARLNRANVLQQLGRSEDALPLYRSALLLEPTMPEARLNLATALFNTGRTAEGETLVRALVADAPDLAPAHLLLAIHLDRSGRREEAEREFREVLRLDPGNARVRARLGGG
jgi:Flp pilus assembly protein TadD